MPSPRDNVNEIQVLITSAFGLPIESSVTKKLLPQSLSDTTSPSTIVIEPTPGKTKFLRVSVPDEFAPSKSTFELLSNFCP